MPTIKELQRFIGVKDDGDWGRVSKAALDAIINPEIRTVSASSFADPEDVRRFRQCKANGGTDQQCFKVGDNGVGFTGLICATDEACLCALPREDWMEKWGSPFAASGKSVVVTYKGRSVVGILGDTMPARANIKNGCGIDLNPGFAKALGVKPPFKLDGVTWKWA